MDETPHTPPSSEAASPADPAALGPIGEKPSNLPTTTWAGDLVEPVPQSILERRATLRFSSEPVPDEYLDAILSLGTQAPSGFNLQPWRFLVLRSPDRRALLHRLLPEQPAMAEAPVVVMALGMKDYERQVESVLREGARRGLGVPSEVRDRTKQVIDLLATVPNDVYVTRHVLVAVTFMMLAAESYGFDTLLAECFDVRAFRESFDLPEEAEVVALLGIGRRAGPPKPYPGRFPVDTVVYDETYGSPWTLSSSPLAPRQARESFENE